MRDSKQIAKILFLCLPSAWFRATTNGRVSTKFPTCVIDTFYVWLKMGRKWLLDRCVKSRKATISSVMSVCPSVRMDGISWNFVLEYFSNMSGKFNFRVNLTRKTVLWHEDLRIFLINSRSTFRMIKMFQRNFVEKIKTHVLWQKMFLQKIVTVKR
jgi:hypothetical protein